MDATPPNGQAHRTPAPRKRRRWFRRILIAGGLLVLVLAVLVALAPRLISTFGRPRAQAMADKAIAGSVKIDRMSLSWGGPQVIGPFTLIDPQGRVVADAKVEVSAGLLGFARMNFDIGRATVTGKADVIRDADGKTNLEKAIAPTSPPASGGGGGGGGGGKPPSVPSSLRGEVVLTNLEATFTDTAAPAGGVEVVALRDINGTAKFAAGQPVTLSLDATAAYKKVGASAGPGPAGAIKVTAAADNLITPAGVIDTNAATIDAKVEATGLAVALADAVANQDGKLIEAMGETLNATLTAKGTPKDLVADVKAESTGVGADLGVRYTPDTVTVARPSVVRVRTQGIVGLVPAAAKALAEQKVVRVDTFPEAKFTIDSARFNLPKGGAPLDLRGAGLTGTLAVSEIAATPLTGAPDPYRIAPFTVKIDAADIAKGARVQTQATATIGQAKAGSLAIDLAASKILDAKGAPRALGPGSLNGTARLADLRTDLAQPFVEKAGLNLAEDVGPLLNVTLNAKGQGAADPAGGAAETDINLTIASQNINGAFTAQRTDTVLRPAGELKITRTGPLATRMLQKAGVVVNTPTGVTLRVRDTTIDTGRIAAAGKALDLGAASGMLTLDVEPASGTVAIKPGEAPQPWELTATTLSVDATDLSKSAVAKLKTSATLAGEPAGLVDVELIAAGLADAAAKQGKPGQVNLRANIKGVATALVQKFVPGETINLPRDIGPRLDINAVANTRPNQKGAGPIPAAAVTLDVRSQNLSTGAKVNIADGAASIAEPITLTIENTGGPASRFIPASLGYSVQQGGKTIVKVTEFTLPLEGDKPTPNLAKMAAAVGVSTTSLAVVPRQSGAVVNIDSLNVALAQKPGADPALTFSSTLRHQDQEGSLLGDLSLRNLYSFKPEGGVSVTPAKALPVGTVECDLPTSLAKLAPAPAAKPGQTPLDLAALVRDTVGPRVAVELVSKMKEPLAGQPQSVDATVKLTSTGVTADAAAVLNEARVDLASAKVQSTVSPATMDRLLATFAPALSPRPRLLETVTPTVEIGALRLPRTPSGGLNLARAGEAKITASVPGRAVLDRLVLTNPDGTTRDLGAVGIEGVQLTAAAPLSAFAAGAPAGEPQRATARLNASLLGANNEKIGALVAEVGAGIAAGKPAGPASAKVRVQNFQTAWIDAFAAQPGLVSGALGPNVSVEGEFNGVFDQPPAGSAGGGGLRDGALTALLAAQRIAMKEKAAIDIAADRLSVKSPPITWKMDPAWANRFVLKPPPGGQPAATFDRPADITLTAKALTIGRGAKGPLAPAVFNLDATVAIPAFQMGVKGQPIIMRDVAAAVKNGPTPGSLAFDVKAKEQGGDRPITIVGTATSVADAQGKPTPDAARLNADVNVPSLATALVDALAQQNGLLVEALGPEITLVAKARDLSKDAGTIDAKATAPNVTAELAGRLEPGRFVGTAPLKATLTRITPELAATLFKGSPVIGNFEKTAKDTPATLVITGLTAPLDNNLRVLNADVNFDPGTATYATGGNFSKILKFFDQRQQGQVGRRLEPLHIVVNEGVATYDRYKLPLGEFSIETKGSVDLAAKNVDVITYIPLGALTDEAAGMINTGLGSAIGRAVPILEKATMIPWRTKGPMDSPSTSPDIGLLVQELGPNLLQGVGKGVGDILKGIGGGGGK